MQEAGCSIPDFGFRIPGAEARLLQAIGAVGEEFEEVQVAESRGFGMKLLEDHVANLGLPERMRIFTHSLDSRLFPQSFVQ